MSFSFRSNELKNPEDDKSSVEPFQPIDFTTAAVRRNISLENGLVGRQIKVINRDTTNNCVLRLHHPQAVDRIIPPSTAVTFTEWFVEFHVIPDGTTGSGQIEIDSVTPQEARKRGVS